MISLDTITPNSSNETRLPSRTEAAAACSSSKFRSILTVVLKVLSAIGTSLLALYDILAVIVLVIDSSRGELPKNTVDEIGLFWEYLGEWANFIPILFGLTICAFLFLGVVVVCKLIRKNFKAAFFVQIFFMVVYLYLLLGSIGGYPILWMLLD